MVQVPGLGSNHRAYLWQYSRPRGNVVFDFQMGRGREGPKKFLGNYEGILQTDGYSAYDEVAGAKVIRAGCWSHARRKFFQALQVDPQQKRALELVAAIDELFSIEARAREGQLRRAATPGATPSRGRTMVGKDQNFGSGSQKGGAATQPLSRRLRLSAQGLETAHLFSATRPAGTLDQSGRKRDPPHSTWPQL